MENRFKVLHISCDRNKCKEKILCKTKSFFRKDRDLAYADLRRKGWYCRVEYAFKDNRFICPECLLLSGEFM